MDHAMHTGRRKPARRARARPLAAVGAAVACALAVATATGPAAARAADSRASAGPDRPFSTPVARGSAAAGTAVSESALRRGLSRGLRRAGGRSGAWVMDADTGRILFAGGAGRRLQLASNAKLFVTAAAIARFGPESRLRTAVWAGDEFERDGVVRSGLFLRGAGDPTLSSPDLRRLAGRVAAAGVERVEGPLLFDDSFLDRRDGIPQRGIVPDSLGTLSALTLDGGRSHAPELLAARRREAGQALRGTAWCPLSGRERLGTEPHEPRLALIGRVAAAGDAGRWQCRRERGPRGVHSVACCRGPQRHPGLAHARQRGCGPLRRKNGNADRNQRPVGVLLWRGRRGHDLLDPQQQGQHGSRQGRAGPHGGVDRALQALSEARRGRGERTGSAKPLLFLPPLTLALLG